MNHQKCQSPYYEMYMNVCYVQRSDSDYQRISLHKVWICALCNDPRIMYSIGEYSYVIVCKVCIYIINPQRACAARVMVLGPCVSLSVCLFVYIHSHTTGYETAHERY